MKQVMLVFSWFCSVMPALVFSGHESGEPGDFQLVKSKGSVALYERWAPQPGGFSVRELKATFTVSGTPDDGIRLLQNEQQAADWMKRVTDFRHIIKPESNAWVTYIRYNVPWPLNDQDCLLRYQLQAEESSILLRFQTTSGKIAPLEGVKRMQGIHGSWLFEPLGANTRVTYRVMATEKPAFPRWATDPIIQNNLLDTLNGFKKLLGEASKR